MCKKNAFLSLHIGEGKGVYSFYFFDRVVRGKLRYKFYFFLSFLHFFLPFSHSVFSHSLPFLPSVFLVCGAGELNQGLRHAKQMLSHRGATPPALSFNFYALYTVAQTPTYTGTWHKDWEAKRLKSKIKLFIPCLYRDLHMDSNGSQWQLEENEPVRKKC